MATPLGILNGENVLLFIDDGVDFILIGGGISHSTNLAFEPIRIDNKSAPGVREFLESEGISTAEITVEVLFSSDDGYELMVQKYEDKEFADIQVRYLEDLTRTHEVKVLVTAMSDSAEQNSGVVSSVTLMNSDEFALDQDVSPP